MRKSFTVLFGLLIAIGVLVSAAGVILLAVDRGKMNDNIQIRTETEPIYNHFPDLPKTSEIQWCSRTSDGIGLTTVKLYFFAFYDYDISNKLQEMKIENQGENIELHFIPDGIHKDEKWRHVENAEFAFQTDIKDTEKMYTTVYINDTGTILYIEAIGD